MTKQSCEECGIKTKKLRRLKGFYYCFNCWKKRVKIIGGFGVGKSLEEALEKVYIVSPNLKHKNGDYYYYAGSCRFPKCLIGKQFKIKLVED